MLSNIVEDLNENSVQDKQKFADITHFKDQ